MKSFFLLIQNLNLRSRLVITYIILITIPLFAFGIRFFLLSKDVISDIAKKNAYAIVKKNNEIIDTKLLQVQDNIFSFLVDEELYKVFSEVKSIDDYNINLLDNKISNILNQYFSHSQDIYSAQLATSYFTFSYRSPISGQSKNYIPSGTFSESLLYKNAKNELGKLSWIPTYEFSKMFNISYLKDANLDYKYLFSAVLMLKNSYYDGSRYLTFPVDIERPVLLVNFKEQFFENVYRSSIPVEGSYYFVITKDGGIISHQDQSKIATTESIPWLKDIVQKASGTDVVNVDGKEEIVCYDTSKVTGWVSVVVIPPDRLLDQILPTLKSYTIFGMVILVIISVLLSYFISGRITNPIQKLIKAVKKTGAGNFDVKIKEEGSIEFKELIYKFNAMNENIQKLIRENYEIKLKEKEAEITALNLQLDPHFMYNTLNMINLISAENGQDEISEMIVSLSRMLRYTVKNRKDLISFKDDLEYLKAYIFIMTKRFEGKFFVEYNIDEKLYEYDVPKFFMQPFVENSLVHGFSSLKKGGTLKITCWLDNDNNRYFCIEDNGTGISEERINEITSEKTNSVGISNVNNRIKIIYGEEYGIKIESELSKGTKITIKLPIS